MAEPLCDTGGMIFPAVAEQLVLKMGFKRTMLGNATYYFGAREPLVDVLIAIALIVLVTLIPANLITRQRPTWKRKGPPQMDWTLFRDSSFLLMTAGKFMAYCDCQLQAGC